MNHATSDTAKRLKEAGLSPVRAEFGQVWYDESGEPFLIAGLTPSGYSIAKANEFGKKSSLDGCVFAPTATDILRQLPDVPLEIGIDYYTLSGESWQCDKSVHETNPAEAAAMAWLQIHSK